MRLEAGDFVLPVDKPEGPTSHDVVASARRALRTRRVGHTGTLDPFASGLLLLCVGQATRLSEHLTGLEKEYEATARLGVSTDSLDREGTIVSETDDLSAVTEERVAEVLASFQGPLDQLPPQFSAKKVDGEAMHRKARRGEHVELSPVPVTIHDIALLSFERTLVRFSVRCSSGTYIRSIARDLGEAIGVGAHLTALRRTSVGRFRVEDSIAVDALDDEARVSHARVDPLSAVSHLRSLEVDDADAARLVHGQRLRVEAPGGSDESSTERVAVVHAGTLLAIGELDDGLLRPRKVFPA